MRGYVLDNFFNYKEKGTNFKTKIMAYILGINPSMLDEGRMSTT